jgi:hypothetical protein
MNGYHEKEEVMKVLLVDADLNHSICPACIALLYQDLAADDDHKLKRRKDDDHER